ncbi:MAG: acyltransferase family protein [Aquihabitans sp.]
MARSGDGEGFSYRPHLDGLRAVAVYLVVAFHAGVGRARGGFIGVDVFFVLSGYLVTHLLLRDLGASGTIRFRRFYSRRVRRLLPAAIVNLVVTAIVFRSLGAPVEMEAATASISAAAAYVSNWWFIREAADYFGTDIAASPVAHYWSLSVEEQFYLVWPVLLAGLYRLTRRVGRHQIRVIQVVVLATGLASLGAALHVADTNLNRAYFGTDTRAYQLLAGAAVALTPGVVNFARRLRWSAWGLPVLSLMFLGALVLSATSKLHVGPVTRGVFATGITVGLIVTLEASNGGIGRRLLSIGSLTYLGRISYGTYLWHWIVILVATRRLEMAPLTTLVVAAPIATGLAALSYEVLEQPIRITPRLEKWRLVTIACGLTVSALVAFVVAPRLLENGQAATSSAVGFTASAAGGTPVGDLWRQAFNAGFDYTACPSGTKDPCTLVEGNGPTVLLAGDSHAGVLAPMLTTLAKKHDLELKASFLPNCPWTLGAQYAMTSTTCFADQANLFDHIIPTADPDLVILAHRSFDDPQNAMVVADQDAGLLGSLTAKGAAAVDRRIESLFKRPTLASRKIVIVEPTPHARPDRNPLTCLSQGTYLEECRFVTSLEPTPEEQEFRRIDRQYSNVWSLDLDPLACPYLPICDPAVGGLMVRLDSNHLTTTFAESLLPRVERFLLDNDIISD